jgi:hypothetical protein
VLGHIQITGNPAFEGKSISDLEAWVEGTRAVATPDGSDVTDASRIDLQATVTLADNSAHLAAVEALATTLKLTTVPTEVFLSIGKTKDVTATLDQPPAGGGTSAGRVTIRRKPQ